MKMKTLCSLFLSLLIAHFAASQSLKTVLLDQLKSTHDKENWFVPVATALEGLTAEQATWSDGSGNHSVGQIANHLLFWNERQLQKFRGQKSTPFNGNNDETFNAFSKEQWEATVKNLNKVLSELEKTIESFDDASLKSWAETIANISAHNAYHTGQIIYVRKQQGSWKPTK
jgi:uncharacterized damage-inducible protein DinB